MSSRSPATVALGRGISAVIAFIWIPLGCFTIFGRLDAGPCGDFSAAQDMTVLAFVIIGVLACLLQVPIAFTQPKGTWRTVLLIAGAAYLLIPISSSTLLVSPCHH